jgi:DNA sulfur modification protein DndD
MKPAFETLGELHDRGKIPNATIPVLEERLFTGTCICGDSLADDGAFGSQRRAYISKLIEESRKADEIQGIVTELYYGSKSIKQLLGSKDAGWISQYTKVVENRDSLGSLRDEEGRKLKALELQIDSLPDSDIQGLREIERNYRDQRDRFNAKQATVGTQIDNLKRDQIRLEAERDRLLREKNKGAKVIAELEATGDIYAVLERAYSHITKEELAKVSALMNKLFLEMIGADPVQGAIINEAAISSEFDIVVHGPQNRTLSPDRDLNGASRRALTLAFILALTKVSEVEAPNVIDTPLGMMSGFVKRSVLRTAIRQSSQLILFLTHDEIAGCEEILDNTAGAIYTLTNPVHFPKMLVHDPGIRVRKVLRCNCNHRSVCEVCERNPDIEPVSELNTEVELRGVAHE